MRDLEISMNPNKLVKHLKKPAREFTKYDIIKFIDDHHIEMLNFRYVGEDGKLKTLNFVITSKEYLESILSTGERVDGSSLFSYIDADFSDLYVIPRFRTAYVNPFTPQPTLDILCSFYTKEGKPLESAPEYILKKASAQFTKDTGYTFKAMGELEYYIISEKDDLYVSKDQKGYHESSPFTNWENLRTEALLIIAQCGGKIKYGHSEVGNFHTDTHKYEQNEIEFTPVDAEEAVEQLIISKWILRMLGQKYGATISFAPKITVGKAGSGLHIHMMIEKDGTNYMVNEVGLTDIAKKFIAGILGKAQSLTAFGNSIPTSYLRLVPHQEAPTMICWGDSNRSVLIRVPLGWIARTNMIKDANPQERADVPYIPGKQTVELRSPDGSADLYHLMAGIILAAKDGLTTKDSLEKANRMYVNVNVFDDKHKELYDSLNSLPISCYESAEWLEKDSDFYQKDGVFPQGTINGFVKRLKAFDDKDMNERLFKNYEEIKKIVDQYIHHM
ncbi:glutamine synthetase family protein [Lutibacter sp.]|uniref:glutamine synthetase family protein n=1 Tax=Lutibacter sp. TaxID=1925666 RepID=UPI00273426E0|nr:glutamine synthetase family protein [Lutibacter sp.]MDP3312954.1 glutamine synthetase family protein [Lutibacter sp.]